MAKTLYCTEIVPGCTHIMTGADEDDVMRQAADHAATEHGMADVSDDLTAKIRERIKDDE